MTWLRIEEPENMLRLHRGGDTQCIIFIGLPKGRCTTHLYFYILGFHTQKGIEYTVTYSVALVITMVYLSLSCEL